MTPFRQSSSTGPYLPAIEVTRGRLVESIHAAAVAVADDAGNVVARLGGVDHVIFLRSAAKPFQAMAVLESGAAERFRLSQEEIAVMTGSHSSEPDHLAAVTSLLEKIGLDPSALQCGTHVPFSRKVSEAYRREGRPFTTLENNCSGKHAGMLAAAVAGGHDPSSYLDPSHPVQQRILGIMADMTGRVRDRIEVAVDGCGAPTFGVALAEAARAFARLLLPESGGSPHAEAAARVVDAMRAHPLMVAGRGMLDTDLTAHPRHLLVAKRGAEGVQCAAFRLPQGGPLGMAAKVGDGDNGRARVAMAWETLKQLGLLDATDDQRLSGERDTLIIRNNAGREVGRVRASFLLSRAS